MGFRQIPGEEGGGVPSFTDTRWSISSGPGNVSLLKQVATRYKSSSKQHQSTDLLNLKCNCKLDCTLKHIRYFRTI